MRIVALLAISLPIALVAGCAGEPGPSPADAWPATTVPPEPGVLLLPDGTTVLAFTDCRQFHTYFPARAEDFHAQVPPGFSLVDDEAGVIMLRVEATGCEAGPGMLWITLPVVPPADLADANASHALAIEAYIDSGTTLAWLHAAGAHMTEACVCSVADAPSPLLADSFLADGEADDYTLQTALAPASGPFDGFRSWTYVTADGKAVARILADNEASVSRGLGTAVLAYTGPGGAPPAAPAEVAHVVDGLAFTWTAELLEVA